MSARKSTSDVGKLKAENSRLKGENDRLKKKASKAQARKKQRRLGVFRKSAVILLVSLAVALLTVGNLLFWTGNTIVKQDRFVAATQPLIKDPAVQSTMALYTTNQIFSNVNVQQEIENVLPPRADFLAPQLTTQIKSFTQGTLKKVLASPKFQDRWNTALAKQHQRLINFASKYQGNGDISLNDVFNQLTAKLSDTKLKFLAGKQLPAKVGDITLISAPWLPAFHNVIVHIDLWRTLAIGLMIISLALAIWLSRRRRRIVYIFSLSTAAMMLATLIALHAIRQRIVGQVSPQYAEGVQHAIQIVFHSLVTQTVTILLAALLIWLIAWVSGPSRGAMSVKRQVNLLLSGKLHQQLFAEENKYSLWFQNNKRLLQWGVVALFGVIMLLVRLTIASLITYAVIIVILVLAIEIIAGQNSKPVSSVSRPRT